jgi:diaminopimelate epimerase
MRIFDADGSEAEACGNGIRCLVRYFADKNSVRSGSEEISVETVAGIRTAVVFKTAGKISKIQTSMGKPEFGNKYTPLVTEKEAGELIDINSVPHLPVTVGNKELCLGLVSMGNPHAVHFTDEPVSDFPLSRLGPQVEHHKAFPMRTNFEIARIINREHIESRVWERGVGETLACGSGACAITVVAQLLGHGGNKVDIKLPGGVLGVEWDGAGEVFLSGPAEPVFTGEWPD